MTKSLATIPLLTLSLAALLISCVSATDYKLTFTPIDYEPVECIYTSDAAWPHALVVKFSGDGSHSPFACEVVGRPGGIEAYYEGVLIKHDEPYHLSKIQRNLKLTVDPQDGNPPFGVNVTVRHVGFLAPRPVLQKGTTGFGLYLTTTEGTSSPREVYCAAAGIRFSSKPEMTLTSDNSCVAPISSKGRIFGRGVVPSKIQSLRVNLPREVIPVDKESYFELQLPTGKFTLSKNANIYTSDSVHPVRVPITFAQMTPATGSPYFAVFRIFRTPKEVIKCDVSHLEKNMVFELFRQTARELKAAAAGTSAETDVAVAGTSGDGSTKKAGAAPKEYGGRIGCRLISQNKPRVKQLWHVESIKLLTAKGLKFTRHYNDDEIIQIMDSKKGDKWIAAMDAERDKKRHELYYAKGQAAYLGSANEMSPVPRVMLNVNPKDIPIRFVFKVLVAGAVDKTPVPVSCFHLGKLTRTLRATFFIDDDEEADGGISCRMERTFWSLNTNSIHKLSSVQAIINTGEKKIQVLRIAQVQSREGTKDVKVETKEKKAKKQKKPKKNQIAPQ